MKIENIIPSDFSSKSAFTPAKKVDCGGYFMIYVSGTQPNKDAKTGKVLSNDIAEQTHQVFVEIDRTLNLAGASLDNVIKATMYLTDLKDFSVVSPIRNEYFKKSRPVATTVEVNRLTRDGAKIEIEVTALLEK